jgi:hypothetical protein
LVKEEKLTNPIKFVFCGHSKNIIIYFLQGIGGLYIRVAIRNIFKNVTCRKYLIPVSYITLCSPHLGIRRSNNSMVQSIFRYGVFGVSYFLGKTTQELSLMDDDQVLKKISEPTYVKYLKLFKYRTLFGIEQDGKFYY